MIPNIEDIIKAVCVVNIFLTLIKEFFNFFTKVKRSNKAPNNYFPLLTILIAKPTARTAPITVNAIPTPE